MTSTHSMQTSRALRRARAQRRMRLRAHFLLFLLLLATCLCACSSKEKLETPVTLSAPYDRPQLWAVVPFTNESGVSVVKPDRVADLFAEQAEDIHGIATVPVNRVLLAMRRLEMRSVNTPGDAMMLMNVLGVDGLIVGTITSYDPYPPPKFGAAVQLYRRAASNTVAMLDPVQISRASTDHVSPGAVAANEPAAQSSGVFDASNNQVLMWLDEYAHGRTEPGSAYGKRIYLANMELYTQFVAFRLLNDLLAIERTRLQPQATQPTPH